MSAYAARNDTKPCPNVVGRSIETHQDVACGRRIMIFRDKCFLCEQREFNARKRARAKIVVPKVVQK